MDCKIPKLKNNIMKLSQTIFIGIFLMWSVFKLSAEFDAVAFNKITNGACQTQLMITTTGEAAPFSIKVYKQEELVYTEDNLESNIHLVNLNDFGVFDVYITDALNCEKAILGVVAECDCDDIEVLVTKPSCHKNNGRIEIIPPLMGMVTVEWIEHPSNVLPGPGSSVGNLIEGTYIAEITITYPNGSGQFEPCTTRRQFNIVGCDCEFFLYEFDVNPNTNCESPNGSVSIPPWQVSSVLVNANGDYNNFTYIWEKDGEILPDLDFINEEGLAEGAYTLSVEDEAGCTASIAFEILNKTTVIGADPSTYPTCPNINNGSSVLNVNFLSGIFTTPPEELTVELNGVLLGTYAEFQVIEDLQAGSYDYTVTNSVTGCLYSGNFIIEESEIVAITDLELDMSTLPCPDNTIGANLSIDGGNPPYALDVQHDAGEYSISNFSGTVILHPGTMDFTVTGHCGNSYTESFYVEQANELFEALYIYRLDEVPCNGYDEFLGKLSIKGGNPPYDIEQLGENGGWIPISHTSADLIDVILSGDSDSFSVTDKCGNVEVVTKDWQTCYLDLKITVEQHANGDIANGHIHIEEDDNNECERPGNYALIGAIECELCDEVGAQISNGTDGGIFPSYNEMHVECLPPGVYEFVYTSSNGCTQSFEVTINDSGGSEEECEDIVEPPCDVSFSGIFINTSGFISGFVTHDKFASGIITINATNSSGTVFSENVGLNTGKEFTNINLDLSGLGVGAYNVQFMRSDNLCGFTTMHISNDASINRHWCRENFRCQSSLEEEYYRYIYFEIAEDIFGSCKLLNVSLLEPASGTIIECGSDCIPESTIITIREELKCGHAFAPEDDCDELTAIIGTGGITNFTFNSPYVSGTVNPVLIAGPLSSNSFEVATTYIAQYSPLGFEIGIKEFDYQDGFRSGEQVSYYAADPGVYDLGGIKMIAGEIDAVDGTNQYIYFPESFSSTPVVMATITSKNNTSATIVRLHAVSKTRFRIALQDEEAANRVIQPERISYMAFEQGQGVINGKNIFVGRTTRSVRHNWYDLSFPENGGENTTPLFGPKPLFFANIQSTYGADPALVSYTALTATGVSIKVLEEQSLNAEVIHTSEIVGYVLIEAEEDCGCQAPLDQPTYIVRTLPVCGEYNGVIELSIKGGESPFIYDVGEGLQILGNDYLISGLTNTTYTLFLEDNLGCSVQVEIDLSCDNGQPIVDSEETEIELTSDTRESEILENELEIYPNPNNGVFTINKKLTKWKDYAFEIFHISGKKVYEKTFVDQDLYKVDLGAYDHGVYIIRIQSKGEYFTKKIIIQ